MRKNFVAVLVITFIFSAVALIPKGFSQWDTKLDYLVNENGKSVEINITTPVYITKVPLEVYDASGKPILQREMDGYFTKRTENTRFNRFVLNIPLPERMPVRVTLFSRSSMERSYTLEDPQIDIELNEGRVKAYLRENSVLNLTVVNGDAAADYSLTCAQKGWHSLDIGILSDKLMQPGSAFYFTIMLPGGLSTTVTRYIPQVFVDAGTGYTNIRGRGISSNIPRISIYNSEGALKYRTERALRFKEGEFLFQENFDDAGREIKDGDRLVYEEEGYNFRFDLPYFFASYDNEKKTISGTVSRRGKVVFRIGSQSLEAEPDERGRFKIDLDESVDTTRLITVRGGYISPVGNEYWKIFDWAHLVKRVPHFKGSQFDIRVMSYNIHHGISMEGKLNIEGIADVIKESGAQIVGLQEVDNGFIRSLFQDQAKELAERLDMYYYFGENFALLGAGYGNAVLSKFPIVSASNLQLGGKKEQRGVISAGIDIYGKEVNFLVTHLSRNRSVRDVQVQQIMRYINIIEDEVILVGDFNSIPGTEEIMYIERKLKETARELGKEDLYTFTGRDGVGARIDYIFLSPEVTVSNVWTIDSDASDHLPLLADIGIKDI